MNKNLIISRHEQGTPEWKADRAGHITGSRIIDIMAVSKRDGKPLQARENYLWEQVTERITRTPLDTVNAYAMQWGKDAEPHSRRAYEVMSGNTITTAGFIKNINIPNVGVSLDGMIDDDGAWENKSPKDSTIHVQTWLYGMPEQHIFQVQCGLWVTEREWCDFTSFDPRFPEDSQLFVHRVKRDEAFIAKMAAAIHVFNREVEQTLEEVLKKIQGVE